MRFRLHRHGSNIEVKVHPDRAEVTVIEGNPVPIRTPDGRDRAVEVGETIEIQAVSDTT